MYVIRYNVLHVVVCNFLILSHDILIIFTVYIFSICIGISPYVNISVPFDLKMFVLFCIFCVVIELFRLNCFDNILALLIVFIDYIWMAIIFISIIIPISISLSLLLLLLFI